jgi:hypothetical protein
MHRAIFINISEDGGYKINLQKARRQGKLHLIKKLRTTEDGTYIELHDSHSALIKLGSHYGLFANDLSPVPTQSIERSVAAQSPDSAGGPDNRGTGRDDEPE